MLPVVAGGGPGGYPGGLLGAEYLPQGLVPVDVFGLGAVVGDLDQVVAAVAVLAGSLGKLPGSEAEVEDRLVDCAGCLLTAGDVRQGPRAVGVEVVFLVIVGPEVKGAVLRFVAVIAGGVAGIAALQDVGPGAGRRGGVFQPGRIAPGWIAPGRIPGRLSCRRRKWKWKVCRSRGAGVL